MNIEKEQEIKNGMYRIGRNDCRFNDVCKRFPKTRIEMPQPYFDIMDSHYLDSRKGRGCATKVASKMERWLHRKVAQSAHSGITLEIGAGTLNQLDYESVGVAYDIVEPYGMLYKTSDKVHFVRNIYQDISKINGKRIYDRIISVACFEHILDLTTVVEKAYELLKDDGVLAVSIPNEGHFIWHVAYKMTTGVEFWLKYKLDYERWMRYEHVNTSDEIETILAHYFSDVRAAYCGGIKPLSFYCYYECRK